MIKVVVASKNPVKIQAVSNGFKKMFPDKEFSFLSLSVLSGVADQPLSDDETLRGANNRVENASEKLPGAGFYVGIEGGLEFIDTKAEAFAWVVIKKNNYYSRSRTATFMLPEKITDLIKEGRELGEADDIVFGLDNSKQKNGAVGILTNNVIDRTNCYTQAVILSLIPFKNNRLY